MTLLHPPSSLHSQPSSAAARPGRWGARRRLSTTLAATLALTTLTPACGPQELTDLDEDTVSELSTDALDPDAEERPGASPVGTAVPDLRTTSVDLGGRRVDLTFENVGGLAVFEGDMVLGLTEAVEGGDSSMTAMSALRQTATWPGGRVPYVIDHKLDEVTAERVQTAVNEWNSQTLVRFVPKSSWDSHFVRFQPLTEAMIEAGNKGKAELGFKNSGEQGIWLREKAGRSTIRHEMGHAVGLMHEHTRADRDNHVAINWDNVPLEQSGNFISYGVSGVYGLDFGAYDLRSLMHYHSFNMAVDKDIPTIVLKGCPLDSRDEKCHVKPSGSLTELDRRGVTRMVAGDPLAKYKLRHKKTGKCLKPQTDAEGARVSLSNCSESTSRRWFEFKASGTSRSVIINEDSRLCLDRDGQGRLIQNPCVGTKSQQFEFEDIWGIGNGDKLVSDGVCLGSTSSQPVFGKCSNETTHQWSMDLI